MLVIVAGGSFHFGPRRIADDPMEPLFCQEVVNRTRLIEEIAVEVVAVGVFRRAKDILPTQARQPKGRLSSLCSFRTLYFTPESGPATEGFSCRGAVMNDEGNAARKIRKLRASRDLWKQRSAEKQQEIRQLRVTVRDLSSSRENWKTRVKELEQQLQAAHEAHAAVGPGSWIFFGGLMDNQAMPRTRRTPITLSSD